MGSRLWRCRRHCGRPSASLRTWASAALAARSASRPPCGGCRAYAPPRRVRAPAAPVPPVGTPCGSLPAKRERPLPARRAPPRRASSDGGGGFYGLRVEQSWQV
eukprot:scaffold89315_cov63-Phaeocystis_antarctica.AAC.1